MVAPKILIVEDSPSIRKILYLQLKEISTDISLANDGLVGLKLAQSQEFDLILSDIDMPNMSGLEMLRELKKNKATRGIPVILLSFMDDDSDVEQGFEAGAAAYVKKSSTDTTLKKTVYEVLDKTAVKKQSQILIVDDSITILRMVEAALAKTGFQVLIARNGEEALEILKSNQPDIIISDLDMPKMNGMELCKRLRKDPELSKIPILIMSANSERSVMRSVIEEGASSYIVKPFNMEQLIITTEKLLSEQFQLILQARERLEEERNMMLASITSLIQALEARDAYTRGHSERVSEFAVGMGQKMGLPEKEIETLKIGGKLHDVGKIGIPDSVLLKEGRLTDEELRVIQGHPVIGADILKPIKSLSDTIPLVLHHHERFDGKGYPNQLKGEEINLLARIMAVADTYDAITSDRPYRKGKPQEVALEIIQEVRGTQLCSKCVDVFMEYIQELPYPVEQNIEE